MEKSRNCQEKIMDQRKKKNNSEVLYSARLCSDTGYTSFLKQIEICWYTLRLITSSCELLKKK